MHINRKRVGAFSCCCYMYLRLFLKIGFCFKIDYGCRYGCRYGFRYCCKDHIKISNTTRSKTLPYNWGKNNITEGYHRRTTLFLGVLSVKTAFYEYMAFIFSKKKIINLKIKVSLNMKNKSDILVL